jgi:hypothetical protein
MPGGISSGFLEENSDDRESRLLVGMAAPPTLCSSSDLKIDQRFNDGALQIAGNQGKRTRTRSFMVFPTRSPSPYTAFTAWSAWNVRESAAWPIQVRRLAATRSPLLEIGIELDRKFTEKL